MYGQALELSRESSPEPAAGGGAAARTADPMGAAARGQSAEVIAADPHAVTAGAAGPAAVDTPQAFARDENLAALQEAMQPRPGMSTEHLVATARMLDEVLQHPARPVGPQERQAIARACIRIYEILDERLATAPLDAHGHPQVEGLFGGQAIEWDPDDPLGGILESVPPFGMLDVWTRVASSPRPERPRVPRPPPRRRGPEPPERTPTPEEPTPEPGPEPPLAEVLTALRLDMAPGSFAAWFLLHYGNTVAGGNLAHNNPTYIASGGSQRFAFWSPNTTERRELLEIHRRADSGPLRTDDVAYFARMRGNLQRVVGLWRQDFGPEGAQRHHGENRWGFMSCEEYRVFSRVMALTPPEIHVDPVMRQEMRDHR